MYVAHLTANQLVLQGPGVQSEPGRHVGESWRAFEIECVECFNRGMNREPGDHGQLPEGEDTWAES